MTITLYRHPLSGHCHRVELFLSLLGVEAELVEVDLAARAQKEPSFLAKNRFGQIPVVEDDALTISDSNAILVYLARRYGAGTGWLPEEAAALSEVQRWLSVAAGPLADGPARARVAAVFGRALDVDAAQRLAHDLLATMDAHLSGASWLVGGSPTIADVACYTYVAHAPEGGVSLGRYPNVRAWLARVEGLRGFVPMARTETAAARSAS